MSSAARVIDSVALSDCDREPIHTPGAIQPHGALLAVDPLSLRIVHAAGDTQGLLGHATQDLPGTLLPDCMPQTVTDRLQALVARNTTMQRPVLAGGIEAFPQGVDVVAHRSGGLLVLECERGSTADAHDPLALVQSMIRHVQQSPTTPGFTAAIAREIRAVCGFDRVMVYHFAADGSGAVIAESCAAGSEPYLGLHYPAEDIPRQARALYLSNWIRMIPDAGYTPAPILPHRHPQTGDALDLSQASLRSVSPVHRQYLANMGVMASMSLSIVVAGELWGLIACHHAVPLHLPYRLREACALFAEMASAQLELRLSAADFAQRLHTTTIHEDLLGRMIQEPDLAQGLPRFGPQLLEFVAATGVGLWIDGVFTGHGTTPAEAEVEALVGWLNDTTQDGIFHTDHLAGQFPPAAGFAGTASGLIALSITKHPRDYVLWFRPEVIRTVSWAGNPNKPAGMLTPRHSFATWRQSVHQQARPWTRPEIDAAHRLRLALLEVVLTRIAQISSERDAAWQQQALLMAELDRGLEEWKTIARALRKETERRAVVEAELSQVLRRTVLDQEAERQRIARELHDTLGQSLSLLQLGLDGIARASNDGGGGPPIAEQVTALKALAAETGRQVNRLAWEIRPTALDDLGIQVAIRNFLESWSETSGVAFDLHLTLDSRTLSKPVETTLYRVLQEALTNVVRHAQARHVGVILGVAGNIVSMIVEDDGTGFSPATPAANTPPGRRLGLLGIRERLTLVEGSLEVESSPGRGTTLFIRIPV